jgi:hypothetical protein
MPPEAGQVGRGSMISWRTTTLGAWRGLREFLAVQVELHERAALLDRPWEEEFLHWAADGRELHGWLVPPRRWCRGTTRSGWCPGMVRSYGASPWTDSRSPA